jgi:hypothetical protein
MTAANELVSSGLNELGYEYVNRKLASNTLLEILSTSLNLRLSR